MSDVLLPAIIGIIGVLVGSFGSILAIYVQSKIHDKRERTKLIVETALGEYKELISIAKNHPGKSTIMPLTGAIHWYSKIFQMIDDDTFNERKFKKLYAENKKIVEIFQKNSDQE